MLNTERFSLDAWARRNRDGTNMPAVLYFDRRKPVEFDDSGLYVCYQDFRNVRGDYRHDISITSAYHALVFYFSSTNKEMRQQARKDLYNNPNNRANWNGNSLTDKYYLHGTTLLPFAEERPTPEFIIPGIGKYGREVLRRVLFDEEAFVEPSDVQLYSTRPEIVE